MRNSALLVFVLLFFFPIFSLAADKVVVIPLNTATKVAGTDGQIQYNDNGKTAGSEVIYDKATKKLQTPGEIRTVDESGNNRLWGKGRPGTELLTHTDSNGYCTNSSGIHYALSATMAAWHNAAEVCPAGTWVCTDSEFPDTEGSCDIQPVLGNTKRLCNGMVESGDYDTHDKLEGWISDLLYSPESSLTRGTFNNIWGGFRSICSQYRVWCCWK